MSEELKKAVIDEVSNVNDPHMGISIVEMGILQEVVIEDDKAKLTIKPTNPGCMSVTRIAVDAKNEALKVDGIDNVEIEVVGHMMADSINEMLNK